jgi:hypothetical protein
MSATRSEKFLLNRMNSTASKVQLGTLLRNRKGTLKCIVDVANVNQGGAVGSHNLLDEDGNAVVLPAGAIITQGYLDIITAFTSTSNDGTIALNCNSAGDLLAAVDADTKSGITALVPVGTAATMVKTTAERTLQYTVAVHALLTGKAHVFLDYVLSSETE